MSLFDFSLCIVIFLSLCIYVWFDTELVPYLLSKIPSQKLKVFLAEYKVKKLITNFPGYLEQSFNCFIFKLLGCPFCISFWSSLFFTLLLAKYIGVSFFVLPLYWYGVYCFYLLIKKLEL
jgi:hypothetical protein